MKRTPLARKTPMRRSTFRHVDSAPVESTDVRRKRDRFTLDVESDRDVRKRTKAAKARKNAYARRPRAIGYMGWVKGLPCLMRHHGGCSAVVEADHAGFDRGVGMKAPDDTCIPLCSQHHHDRHHFTGPFKGWNKESMRAWRLESIKMTQELAAIAGVDRTT